MATLNDKQLLDSVKKKEFYPVYFFYGPERYMLDGCVSSLTNTIVDSSLQGFNLQKIDGSKCKIDEIETAVETLPVMAEKKCVLITDLNIEKLAKNENTRIKSMLKDLPVSCVLVFAAQHLDINLKKNTKFLTFAKNIDKIGCVVEFSYKSKTELSKILVTRAKKSNCTLSLQNARELVNRCGPDLHLLLVELDKLTAYKKESEISKEDILALVSPTMESSAFDLAKAILSSNYNRAFGLLQDFKQMRQDEIAVLGALSMSFMDIYRAKVAMSANKSVDVITSFFNYKGREFRIKNAYRDCSKFSSKTIQSCINILMDADTMMKTTAISNQILLEEVVAKMLVQTS